MKKLLAVVLAVALAVLAAGCARQASPSGGGEAITIRVSTVQMDGQQMGKAAQHLQQLVDERLDGRVNMLTYTGGQLYSNTEELEALKAGDIQIAFVVGSTMGTLDDAFGIFKLPFIFPNVEAAYSILDGPTGDLVFANIKAQGIDVLGGFSSGAIIVANSSRPLRTPADFSGLKIRASGAMESAIIDALGAISTVIPSEETYTGLQQKVVDGVATPSTVFAARRYHEVQSYVTNAGMLYWSNGFIAANDSFWQGLPADVRAELEAIVAEVLKAVRDADENELNDMLGEIAAEGVEVHNMSGAEIEAWREASKSVYDDYAAEIGPDLIAEVQRAVAAFAG